MTTSANLRILSMLSAAAAASVQMAGGFPSRMLSSRGTASPAHA